MKKIIIFVLAFMILSSTAFCAGVVGKKNTIGLDAPIIGWLNPNLIDEKTGFITSNLGINYGLGVSYKRYFNPLGTNKFNPYWCAGTFAIILPYIGIGGDYVWDNGFYFGGGLIYIIPEIHGGFLF
jgi:hypothetical protein